MTEKRFISARCVVAVHRDDGNRDHKHQRRPGVRAREVGCEWKDLQRKKRIERDDKRKQPEAQQYALHQHDAKEHDAELEAQLLTGKRAADRNRYGDDQAKYQNQPGVPHENLQKDDDA